MGNILDKSISIVSPRWGVKRAKARAAIARADLGAAKYNMMAGVLGGMSNSGLSGFTGAKNTTAMKGWPVTHGHSPDMDNINGMETLRDRARDLQRNNPIAKGVLDTVKTNVVGTGLKMQSRIDRKFLGLTDEEADIWQDNVEREFKLWADDPRHCDAASTLNFRSAQSLAFFSTLLSGDVFVALPHKERPGLPYNLKFNVIEADRVCNPNERFDTDKLAGGVEVDEDGSPLNYHILRTHPGGFSFGMKRDWDTIPVFGKRTGRRNILHMYEMVRPGQRRGVPMLAPIIEILKQLGRYTDAEIAAAVLTGFFAGFIESGSGEFDSWLADNVDDDNSTDETSTSGGDDSEIDLANGTMTALGTGEKITFADPKRPNSNFDPFVMSILRQIGAALGMGYELVVKHFTASYSASRAALLEAGKMFKKNRVWLADNFCQPVFEEWLTEAISSGRISAPGFFDSYAVRKAYAGTEWQGDTFGQLDPVKETNALTKQIKEGLTTRSAAAVQLNGSNVETNIPQLGKENRLMKAAGLLPDTAEATPDNEKKQPKKDTDKDIDKKNQEDGK